MGFDETRLISSIKDDRQEIRDIITSVYNSLKEKGYNPINQFVGYIISGDPTYITSYNNARVQISSLDRDDILQELLESYLIDK